MINIAEALNSFASETEQADVPQLEESVFVLTGSQLQNLLYKAVQECTQPLKAEIQDLKSAVARQDEKLASMESIELQDMKTLSHDISDAYTAIDEIDAKISRKHPGKTEIFRVGKIEKYLADRSDHKATFESLKGHLGVDNVRLNEAIKALMDSSPGRYGIIRTPGDKRKRTLVMLPK
jgi:hypothetical protein